MITDRLKAALISFIDDRNPSAGTIVVRDAVSTSATDLPLISVGISGCEQFNPTLVGVRRAEVEITLRAASGDDDEIDVDGWLDSLETTLNDPSLVMEFVSSSANGIRLDHWEYGGAESEWNEKIVETRFTATAIFQRVAAV